MSKCSVCSTLKSKFSHWTLLRPKYWACAVGVRRRKRTRADNTNRETTRIKTPQSLIDTKSPPGCKSVAKRREHRGGVSLPYRAHVRSFATRGFCPGERAGCGSMRTGARVLLLLVLMRTALVALLTIFLASAAAADLIVPQTSAPRILIPIA